MYMMASRAAGIFVSGFCVSDASAGDLFKLDRIGLIPFASLVVAGVLARRCSMERSSRWRRVYRRGLAAPIGFRSADYGNLGAANFEVIVVRFVFALSYNILMLYSGCSRIAGIIQAGAAPAVPVMLIISAWLTKVIIAAML